MKALLVFNLGFIGAIVGFWAYKLWLRFGRGR